MRGVCSARGQHFSGCWGLGGVRDTGRAGSLSTLVASLGFRPLAQNLTAGAFGLFRDSDVPLTTAAGPVVLCLLIRIRGLLGPGQEHRIRSVT